MSGENEACANEVCEQRVETLAEVQRHTETRMSALEDRVQVIETLASRVPGIEARMSRIERLMLEVQGDMRKVERAQAANHETAIAHYKAIEGKIDRLLSKLEHVDQAMRDDRADTRNSEN